MARAKLSVLPQYLDLSLYAGDGLALRLVVTDSLGEPLPLSGAVTSQIRPDRSSTAPPQEFAVDMAEALAGIVALSLSGEQTAALGKFKGVWDVQWEATGAEPRTILQGNVVCEEDVTRP